MHEYQKKGLAGGAICKRVKIKAEGIGVQEETSQRGTGKRAGAWQTLGKIA
jgi:hypothetical protein